uniref:RBBP8 pseudogene 1 n=1 Tax=Homo sapiens TaxID=9606 RepID=A0ABB0MV52_HUMAN
MMQAGNEGVGGRRGCKKSSGRESSRLSVCDLESDNFKKTWLALKELHDKELRRLQAKLTSLRKQRLSDGRRTGSTAKIKELTKQQRVLQSTINDLKDQLKAKTCDCCSMTETYRLALEKDYYEIQQQNLFFIAELTKETNKLREENKRLSKIIMRQQQFQTSGSDDFVSGSQMTMSDFSVREPAQGRQRHVPIKSISQSQSKQMKPTSTKELQQSSEFPAPSFSQGLFEVPETSFAKSSSNDTKPNIEDPASQKPLASSLLTTSLSPQKRYEFQDFFNLHEDKIGQPKGTLETKVSPQKETQIGTSWNPSAISPGEYPTHVSESLLETLEDYSITSYSPLAKEKKIIPLNVLPLDSTLKSSTKRRAVVAIPSNTKFAVRDSSNQIPSNEQSASENINESTSAGYGADKPQCDTESVFLESGLKRKVKTQSQRKRK